MIIQLLKDKRHCLLAGTSTLSSSARRHLRPPEPSDSFLSQAVCSHDLMTSLMASSIRCFTSKHIASYSAWKNKTSYVLIHGIIFIYDYYVPSSCYN